MTAEKGALLAELGKMLDAAGYTSEHGRFRLMDRLGAVLAALDAAEKVCRAVDSEDFDDAWRAWREMAP